MPYLGLALFAEGPSDHRFLRPLLARVCQDLCLRHAINIVEIGDVLELHSPHDLRDDAREYRISGAASSAASAWHILFIHTDGGGDVGAAFSERVEPAVARLATTLTDRRGYVAVVPVRETEAWMLADPDGLQRAFGFSRWGGTVEPIARAADVETLPDPKQTLKAMFHSIRQSGTVGTFYELVGEYVSLDRLRQVPAYQVFEFDLNRALEELRFVGR